MQSLQRLRLAIGESVRRLPGGASALRLRRRAVAAARRRRNPVRPPLHDAQRIAVLSAAPTNHSFITGNGLAARCRYVINYDVLTVNEEVENDWWFCRSDFLEYFFASHEPSTPYVLFSHNSDRTIDRSFRRFLRRRALRAWFAVNVEMSHPKLHAFPLGIANPGWPHGNGETLAVVQSENHPKTSLFDASYDVSTYPPAREYCREQTGIPTGPRRPFIEYLRGVASAYFCIAPRGNGLDTHRIWEALYLRTVPIVTRTVLTDQLPDLPMVILDDWSDFRDLDATPDLYSATWGSFRPASLELDRYMERVEAVLSER